MFSSFFALAAQSPSRQRRFRQAVAAHLVILASVSWVVLSGRGAALLVGRVLLTTGIVEGAFLIGWRLTQLPKSQALEFLLVSPVQPRRVLLAEAAVGLARLALVTLSGLPVLVLLAVAGQFDLLDAGPLLLVPCTWGALTGLGLTVWGFEGEGVRRWGERILLVLLALYFGVGMLVGEHLGEWIGGLPEGPRRWVYNALEAFFRYNPFAVLEYWLAETPEVAGERLLGVEAVVLVVLGLLLARAAFRLKGHFHDRHYQPVVGRRGERRGRIGEWPLSWWAVRRVTEYSGRINLWLAGGFGVAYAVFLVAGPWWPAWLGRRVFDLFEQAGGVPTIATVLVVLAAVPAAFQYGLWDSSAPDRCRRLELLLLSDLEGTDYWHAAARAAWKRGRGYFAVAVLLWLAAGVAGQISWGAVLAALASGTILWGLYFSLGFRAFARGMQANSLGLLLTVGLPVLVYGLHRSGWPWLAGLLPPGSVFGPAAGTFPAQWLPGPLLGGLAALALARLGLTRCERELRGWYNRHQGAQELGVY